MSDGGALAADVDEPPHAPCGVLYAASGSDRYVEEAFLSADSVRRRCPALPITLFTDRPQHPLCALDRFDTVCAVPPATGIASAWAAGQLVRLRCLRRTPYERTVHLDTDTRLIAASLDPLFAALESSDVAFAETATDDSFSRRHFGRPMFNAGVIAYRRSDAVLAWLEAWERLSEHYFRLAGKTPLPEVPALAHVSDEAVRRRLLTMDQISLVALLSPETNLTGLSVQRLDYAWNHRGSRLPENNVQPVRLLHAPALKDLTVPDLLALASDWARCGRSVQAAQVESYVASRFPATG